MDTTYHSNISVETLSLLDCDVRNFDFNHPIKRTDSIKITLKDSMSMPSSNPLTMIPKIVKIFKAG